MKSTSSVSATNWQHQQGPHIQQNKTKPYTFSFISAFSTTDIPPRYSSNSLKRNQEQATMFNNDISRKDHADIFVQIDTEPELD